MSRRSLTFDELALISLGASPSRLLGIEGKTVEEAIQELLQDVTQYPKRTKHQVNRYGPGQPTIRKDLVAIALGDARRHKREAEGTTWGVKDGTLTAIRVLEAMGEHLGGLDEELIAAHEWPPAPWWASKGEPPF